MEIFESVILNDPYGPYADKAQFKIGECYDKEERFSEAAESFQKLIDEYPRSALLGDAKYRIALSTYKASLGPDYDQEITDEAIGEFKDFVEANDISRLAADAEEALAALKEKKAKSLFDVAAFYESQSRFSSAAVYYKDVVEEYPDTSYAGEALAKYTEMEAILKDADKN